MNDIVENIVKQILVNSLIKVNLFSNAVCCVIEYTQKQIQTQQRYFAQNVILVNKVGYHIIRVFYLRVSFTVVYT